MLMEQARKDIVDYGKRLISDGLTNGTAGNISIFDSKCGYMAISPSGIPYADTRKENVVIMDLQGNIIEGECKPSSEYELHSVFYRQRKDINAVVHAHSMFCTTLACLGTKLKSVHYMLADAGVSTIPMAPYRTFGTKELADVVAETIGNESKGILLANHGMIACGSNIKKAFGLALTMEWCAQLQWRCMCAGIPNIISDEDMQVAMEHFKSYGQVKKDHDGGGYNG